MSINKLKTAALNCSDSRLTGNLKIVIDSNNKLFLNSVNSNEFMNKAIYNKFKIDSEFSLDYSFNRFLTQEKITNLSYLFENSNQDEFSAKCSLNNNVKYSEKFKIFAPLYIHPSSGKPDIFVIFKKNKKNILDSQILKIFNLNVGEFDKIFNSDFVKSLPSEVWYKEAGSQNEYFINGLSYNFACQNKIFKILDTDIDISVFADVDLISYNHFNFEFMFDANSDNASDFFGFYFNLDKNSISKIELDVETQNSSFTNHVNPNNYSTLDNSKFIMNNADSAIFITNNINIPKNKLNSIYTVEDSENNIHNISSSIKNVLFCNSSDLNYSNLFGINKKSHFNIPGKLFYDTNSIRVDFDYRIGEDIFEPSDYVEIESKSINSMRYRAYASKSNCCNDTVCKKESVKYKFKSNKVSVSSYPGFNVIKVTVNNPELPIEVNQVLKATCKSFTNKELCVNKVLKYSGTKYLEIYFVDTDGLFNYFDNYEHLSFELNTKPYEYVFFNPSGSPSAVARKIAESFKKFNLQIFDFTNKNNSLIVTSKYSGGNFTDTYFNINTGSSSTSIEKFKINNIPTTGTSYSYNDKLIIQKKFVSGQFTGPSSDSQNSIAIHKSYEYLFNENIAFSCFNGIRKPKLFDSEGLRDKSFKSNYIIDSVSVNSVITDFENIDNLFVITTDNDTIITDSNGIDCYSIFSPLMKKFDKILSENI